jgi:hypothetical protein
VVCFFMALLSFRGISTPSLRAQGEQRRSSLFNIPRDIAIFDSVDVSRSEGLQTQVRPGPIQTRIDLVCQPNSVKPC